MRSGSRSSRLNRKSARQLKEEEGYEDGEDADAPGSSDEEMDVVHTTPEPEQEIEEETNGRPYALRTRTKQINYAIPPPLEETIPLKGQSRPNKGKGRQGPGWSATGAELSKYFDDSVSSLLIHLQRLDIIQNRTLTIRHEHLVNLLALARVAGFLLLVVPDFSPMTLLRQRERHQIWAKSQTPHLRTQIPWVLIPMSLLMKLVV